LSVSKITDTGFKVRFRKNDAVIMKNKTEVFLRAERYGNLYYVDTEQQQQIRSLMRSKTTSTYGITGLVM